MHAMQAAHRGGNVVLYTQSLGGDEDSDGIWSQYQELLAEILPFSVQLTDSDLACSY